MNRISLFTIIVLSLTACRVEDESLDQKTFAAFDKLCKEQATEFVDKGAAYGSLTMYKTTTPSSPGPGKANRGVYDSEYHPDQLLKALLTGPDHLPTIRYVYSYYSSGQKVPKIYEECKGSFYVDLAAYPFRAPPCEEANKLNPESDAPRYVIDYYYGELDENEIRPFTFRLRDVITERVLVEQKSFQLLLGGMSATKNQSFTYIGWSQKAKTCRLSPPDLLIKQAFSKKCITTQSS